MAMRRATRTFPDIQSFAEVYHGDLRNGFLVLPAEAVTDEPANPLKLDLMLPVVGRVGPITAQVMSRTPEGGLALRLPELQLEAGKGIASLWAAIDEVKAWLLSSGAVSPAGGGPADAELLARIEVLEAENAVLRDALDAFLDEEAAKPSDDADQDAPEAEGDEDALIDDEESVDDSPEADDGAPELDDDADSDDPAGERDVGGPAQPSPAPPTAKVAARGFQVPDLRGRAARMAPPRRKRRRSRAGDGSSGGLHAPMGRGSRPIGIGPRRQRAVVSFMGSREEAFRHRSAGVVQRPHRCAAAQRMPTPMLLALRRAA